MYGEAHACRRAQPEAPPWRTWQPLAALTLVYVVTWALMGELPGLGERAGLDPAALGALARGASDATLLAVAWVCASLTTRPTMRRLGLVGCDAWTALTWASLGLLTFLCLTTLYAAVVRPEAEPGIAAALSESSSGLGLMAVAVGAVVTGPIVEEVFFRGLVYRALRWRFRLLVAACLDGLVFGASHYMFGPADQLLLLPPIVLLGGILCVVYERTGSLYPAIAAHSVNNCFAYLGHAPTGPGRATACALGIGAVAVCALAMRSPRPSTDVASFTRPSPRPRRIGRRRAGSPQP